MLRPQKGIKPTFYFRWLTWRINRALNREREGVIALEFFVWSMGFCRFYYFQECEPSKLERRLAKIGPTGPIEVKRCESFIVGVVRGPPVLCKRAGEFEGRRPSIAGL